MLIGRVSACPQSLADLCLRFSPAVGAFRTAGKILRKLYAVVGIQPWVLGLGFGVAAGGSLDALPAGPDIAVSGHSRTIPLCDGVGNGEVSLM